MDSVFPTPSFFNTLFSTPSSLINNSCNLDTLSLLSGFFLFLFLFFYIKSAYFCSFKWPYFGRIAIFAIFFKQSIFHHLVAAARFSPFAALNGRIVYYIRFPPTDTASYWDKSLISSILDCLVRINDLKSSSMFADI